LGRFGGLPPDECARAHTARFSGRGQESTKSAVDAEFEAIGFTRGSPVHDLAPLIADDVAPDGLVSTDPRGVLASFKARKRRAVGDRGFDPDPQQNLDTAICMTDRVARHVRAGCCTDRSLTMLVDHDLEPTDEYVDIVSMERAPEVAFVIEKLVFVLGPFDRVAARRSPYLANHEDRLRSSAAVGQEATQFERENA